MKRFTIILLLLFSFFVATAPAAERPALWAQPVAATTLKNFHQLDAKVYRSAQPDAVGFAELKQRGIVTVLNLRDNHSDDAEAKGTGLDLRRIEMEADDITVPQLIAALRIIHQAKGPVLVHCWHGSDRTGAVSAAYRIVVQGWEKEAAIAELVDGGYGYHSIYGNIPQLLRGLDVAAVKRAVFAP